MIFHSKRWEKLFLHIIPLLMAPEFSRPDHSFIISPKVGPKRKKSSWDSFLDYRFVKIHAIFTSLTKWRKAQPRLTRRFSLELKLLKNYVSHRFQWSPLDMWVKNIASLLLISSKFIPFRWMNLHNQMSWAHLISTQINQSNVLFFNFPLKINLVFKTKKRWVFYILI